jgi:hypothetical protein
MIILILIKTIYLLQCNQIAEEKSSAIFFDVNNKHINTECIRDKMVNKGILMYNQKREMIK